MKVFVDDDIISKAQDAWGELKALTKTLRESKKRMFPLWLQIGEALVEGRNECRKVTGAKATGRAGRKYNEEFGRWLKTYGFNDIDQAARKNLLDIMDNRAEVEAWHAGLDEDTRVTLNHPNSVWRHYQRWLKDQSTTSDEEPTTRPSARPSTSDASDDIVEADVDEDEDTEDDEEEYEDDDEPEYDDEEEEEYKPSGRLDRQIVELLHAIKHDNDDDDIEKFIALLARHYPDLLHTITFRELGKIDPKLLINELVCFATDNTGKRRVTISEQQQRWLAQLIDLPVVRFPHAPSHSPVPINLEREISELVSKAAEVCYDYHRWSSDAEGVIPGRGRTGQATYQTSERTKKLSILFDLAKSYAKLRGCFNNNGRLMGWCDAHPTFRFLSPQGREMLEQLTADPGKWESDLITAVPERRQPFDFEWLDRVKVLIRRRKALVEPFAQIHGALD